MIKIETPQECFCLTVHTISLLQGMGFHIETPEEAFICLRAIVEKHVETEVNMSMQELNFYNRAHTIDSKMN